MDEHGIGHTNPSDPSRDKNAVPIRKFHAARLADLAKRLAAIPEGNGTMFDNTLIVWMSDSAEELRRNRHSASRAKGPVICQPRATPWVCFHLYLSLLRAVGDKRDKFGDPDNPKSGDGMSRKGAKAQRRSRCQQAGIHPPGECEPMRIPLRLCVSAPLRDIRSSHRRI